MKSLFFASLLASTFATSSYAAVVLVDTCHTSDGQYAVSISNNQGIGPDRTGHLQASIADAEGNVVGSYDLTDLTPHNRSASFGHVVYVDQGSKGQDFTFNGKSTNTPANLKAVLSDGTVLSYGANGDQGKLSCSK